MATNYIKPGQVITVTASAARTSGDPVVFGRRVGVVGNDAASGEHYPLSVEGVWELPKATGTAHAEGDVIDFDVSAGKFTTLSSPASGDITGAGEVVAAAASDDTVVQVRLEAGTVN